MNSSLSTATTAVKLYCAHARRLSHNQAYVTSKTFYKPPRPLQFIKMTPHRIYATSESPSSSTELSETPTEKDASDASTSNGTSPSSPDTSSNALSPDLQYVEPTRSERAVTNFKLFFALPWRRFKSGSVLSFKLSGAIAEQPQSRFSQTTSLPAVCDSLIKASYDPRVVGLVVKIDPLSCGWGKIQEMRRHVEFFRKSGKFTVAYMERAGEKEYFLASAFEEIYAPPSASVSLRGFSVSGTFLRGALEKVGVEPEIRRIGEYKSAGDQLLRKDMSEAQKEQLTAVLNDVYDNFVDVVANARDKTRADVEGLLDAGMYEMSHFKEGGWVTDLKYEDEINDMIKERTGGKEDELRAVGLKKYASIGRSAFNLNGRGKVIAIVRTSGAITAGGGGGAGTGTGITAGAVISQLRALKKNKRIAAVVLRVDSPGGDALASDLMWREIQKLSEEKPVIASMADVAASGGYYMSMACRKIVAEALTLTGSIGVVTGKFNLAQLYDKIGYGKTTLSRGRYAELLNEARSFSEDESELFDRSAQYAYEQFRDKAAQSRNMDKNDMQQVAQGRVWSGKAAATKGLVDAIGGVQTAISLAKEAAGMKADDRVRVIEVSRASVSPLALLTGGGGATAFAPLRVMATVMALLQGGGDGSVGLYGALGAPVLLEAMLGRAAMGAAGVMPMVSDSDDVMLRSLASGVAVAQLPGLYVDGVGSAMAMAAAGEIDSSSSLSSSLTLPHDGDALFPS